MDQEIEANEPEKLLSRTLLTWPAGSRQAVTLLQGESSSSCSLRR
jgi:hypothetical protein